MTPTGRRLLVAGIAFVAATAVTFGALAPPEHCPDTSSADLHRSADEAVAWFVRNQRDDGTWLYEYDADAGTVTDDYNLVRHAGAIMGLYQAATAGIDGARESADRGLAWAEGHLIEHDGWTALAFEGRAPAGASALLAAGLAERRVATGDTAHDDSMRSLGRFLQSLVEPTGALTAQYDATAMAPEAGSRSKYYTGEAYWALARLHLAFPDEGFGASADRLGQYLTRRDDVEGIWPPIPDHWAAYGLAETATFPERDPERPLTDAELALARRQAGLFGSSVRWVSQQAGPWGAVVRGTRQPRGGGYGVVGEALTGLWRVASVDERLADLRGPLAQRATCIAGLAVDAQGWSGPAPVDAAMTDGAWFIDGTTRMDDQQHALSALLRTAAIVEAPEASGRDAPSGWLWALALLAVLNPVWVALAVPGSARRERAEVAATGVVVGAAIVVLAAAVSGAILRALDVSPPALRLAVGIVCAVAGVVRMVGFGRGPRTVEGASGRAAALVPVAIPLVASPALILLGLSAGVDLGVWFVVACLAIGVAVTTAVAASRPDGGPARTMLRWAGALLAAGAVAAGVLLVIDATFDV